MLFSPSSLPTCDFVSEMPDIRLFREQFKKLDEKVQECFQYVEPVEKHLHVYSKEFYTCYLTLCATVDSLLHVWYVRKYGKKHTTIYDYYPLFKEFDIDIMTATVLRLRDNVDLEIRPFEGWTEKDVPTWWHEYKTSSTG